MTCTTGWLSVTALVFLVAINAVANGYRVAAEREAELKPSAARVQRRGAAAPRRAIGAVLNLAVDSASRAPVARAVGPEQRRRRAVAPA